MCEHILVTGGAGFVGSSIALALRQAFPETAVTALDNLRRRGSELNLGRLQGAGARFLHGDVRCAADLALISPPPGLVVECSAEPSVTAGYGEPVDYLVGTNLTGCFHCLELARRSQAGFLFLSTSRVYPYHALNRLRYVEEDTRFSLSPEQEMAGASAEGVSEEFPLAGPRSLYGMTKLAAELMVQEYAAAYGLPCIINRCGLITGPWQMGRTDQGVVALWMLAHHFGQPLRYLGFNGTGKQVRDLLHIDDFCDLVVDQARHIDRYAGQVLNVGGGLGVSLSLREMTELCREITGRRVPVTPVPDERRADLRIYISDCRRVTAVRGWRPRRDARTTLSDIDRWIRSEEGALKPVLLAGLV